MHTSPITLGHNPAAGQILAGAVHAAREARYLPRHGDDVTGGIGAAGEQTYHALRRRAQTGTLDAADSDRLLTLADGSVASRLSRLMLVRTMLTGPGRSMDAVERAALTHCQRGARHHLATMARYEAGQVDSIEGVPINAGLAYLALASARIPPADVDTIVPSMAPGAAAYAGADSYVQSQIVELTGEVGPLGSGGSVPSLGVGQGQARGNLRWLAGEMSLTYAQQAGLDFAGRSGLPVINAAQGMDAIMRGQRKVVSDRQLFGDTTLGLVGLYPRAAYTDAGALSATATVDSVIADIVTAVAEQIESYDGSDAPDSLAVSAKLAARLAVPYATSGGVLAMTGMQMLRQSLDGLGIRNVPVVESLDRIGAEGGTWGAKAGYNGALLYRAEHLARVEPLPLTWLPSVDGGVVSRTYLICQIGEVAVLQTAALRLLAWQLA